MEEIKETTTEKQEVSIEELKKLIDKLETENTILSNKLENMQIELSFEMEECNYWKKTCRDLRLYINNNNV